nr:MAG TPA: hypothetical protein [Caudoviricetes sp.]
MLYQRASAIPGIFSTQQARRFQLPSLFLHQQRPDASQSLSLPVYVNWSFLIQRQR